MPIRTCLVTKKKAEQTDFFRFIIRNGELVFDLKKKQSGRGGYVEKTTQSLEKLKKLNKKIEHFLKTTVVINNEVIEKQKILLSK